jgi:hypothetical protein
MHAFKAVDGGRWEGAEIKQKKEKYKYRTDEVLKF